MEVAGQGLFVDNGDPRRGRKVEFHLGKGQVLFPGAETELGCDVPRFSNQHPHEMRLRIGLEENIVQGIAGSIGGESGHASQDSIPWR